MSKTLRHSRIRELIVSRPVKNQEELKGLLQRNGVDTTQATLSRDLRELGAVKGPTGYSLNGAAHAYQALGEEFARSARLFLTDAQHAGNVAVVKTAPGNAHALAVSIDRAKLAGVLGTLAGDDTIFCLTRSPSDAKRLARFLLGLAQTR